MYFFKLCFTVILLSTVTKDYSSPKMLQFLLFTYCTHSRFSNINFKKLSQVLKVNCSKYCCWSNKLLLIICIKIFSVHLTNLASSTVCSSTTYCSSGWWQSSLQMYLTNLTYLYLKLKSCKFHRYVDLCFEQVDAFYGSPCA